MITCNPRQAKTFIEKHYQIQQACNNEQLEVPFFTAPPGVGKNAIVNLFFKEFQERRLASGESEPILKSIRLGLADNVTISGACTVVTSTFGSKETYIAPPQGFPIIGQPESADGKYVVLLLDEFMQAAPMIQSLATSYLDGLLGSELLDLSRLFVIVLSNGLKENASTSPLPSQIKGRVSFYYIQPNLSQWIEDFANPEGVSPLIITYLLNNPKNLYIQNIEEWKKMATETAGYHSPRSWHRLSRYLNICFDSPNAITDILATSSTETYDQRFELELKAQADVGPFMGNHFIEWTEKLASKIQFKNVLEGKANPYKSFQDKEDQVLVYSYILQSLYSYIESIFELHKEQEKRNVENKTDSPKNIIESRKGFTKFVEATSFRKELKNAAKWFIDAINSDSNNRELMTSKISLLFSSHDNRLPLNITNDSYLASEIAKATKEFNEKTYPTEFIDLFLLTLPTTEFTPTQILAKYQ